MTKKIRVAVLYGGRSGEHEVSLQSAAAVVRNLDQEKFEVVPIGIDKQGRWWLNDLQQLPQDTAIKSLPLKTSTTEALSDHGQRVSAQTNSNNPEKNLAKISNRPFDVIFPVVHGVLCEDGTLQGLFESMDVPFIGAGVLGSALGMDKDVSKRLVAANGIAVPDFITIKAGAWSSDQSYYEKIIAEKFKYPVFVKPANTGSSVGVHKVKSKEFLTSAINDAFLYDTKILIEAGIDAREIELSVLENSRYGAPPLVSIPGEIIPNQEFYSYAAKYLDAKGADLLIPANISAAQLKHAQKLAAQIFEILECEGMARADLFLDKKTGEFYFNEINTLPGFTQISMYPKLWEASGISYKELLSRLIDLALARHERKQNLKREWAIE